MHDQGIPIGEIRDFIDEEYSQFAEPTPTPHPDH